MYQKSTAIQHPDRTSFGDVSMQIRAGADTLNYKYEYFSDYSRKEIVKSLKRQVEGIYIMARHLACLRDIDYKGIGATELTEDEVKYISTRYNLGSGRTLDEIKNTCGYGQHVLDYKELTEELLYGSN